MKKRDAISRYQSAQWLAAAAACLTGGNLAQGLTIQPYWGSSITSLSASQQSAIETSIMAAIGRVEPLISNNITVSIDFENTTSGLGGSQTTLYGFSYSNYLSMLSFNQNRTALDNVALANLPASNPVPGASSNSMALTSSLLRALQQQNTPGALSIGQYSGLDGIISLNTSLCNISDSNRTQNSGKYDLEAVTAHEIDEVLGIGGTGSTLGSSLQSKYVGALDVFRYSSPGVHSFTTSATATSYFSIDNGVTRYDYFCQNNLGADFADWGNGTQNSSGSGNSPPQAQDAFGTPGVLTNIGSFEVAALDVEGYDLTAAGVSMEPTVPEPGAFGLLVGAGIGLLARPRRKRQICR